jgi:hypothetical protein
MLVGNANERYFGGRVYNVERKLAHGFTRNGHLVYFFSDRDVARAGTIFRSSRAGRGVANQHFLDVVKAFAPDFVVFVHSCLIATDTFARAREIRPGLRLAQVCVDPLFRPSNVTFLVDRARAVDATFVTTAGAALAQFSTPASPASYMPNPIDPSIEIARGFERDDQTFDVFWAARAGGGDHPADPRVIFPLHLEKSGQVRIDYHGIGRRPQLFGADYFRRLTDARMGLNVNSDRLGGSATQAPADQLYLYNSDRIAQIMGSGLLAISMRQNSLGEMFEEDREMVFADTVDELLDTVLHYKSDDAARRRIAEAGWRKSQEELNERLVARYLEEVTFGQSLSHRYIWPTRLW